MNEYANGRLPLIEKFMFNTDPRVSSGWGGGGGGRGKGGGEGRGRGHNLEIKNNVVVKNNKQKNLTWRGSDMWNSLPPDVRNITTFGALLLYALLKITVQLILYGTTCIYMQRTALLQHHELRPRYRYYAYMPNVYINTVWMIS